MLQELELSRTKSETPSSTENTQKIWAWLSQRWAVQWHGSHIPDWIALAMADFCGKKLGKSFVVTFARIGLDSSKRLIQ